MNHYILNPKIVVARLTAVFCSTLIVIIAAFGATNVADACHPLHESSTEIRCNLKTGSLEITMCLWATDLGAQLTKAVGNPVSFDSPDKVQGLDNLIKDYVGKNFCLLKDGETTQSRWIGYEVDSHRVWAFFEIKDAADSDSWTVTNTIFHDLNENQSNAVTFGQSDRLITIYCHPTQPSQTLRSKDMQPLRSRIAKWNESTSHSSVVDSNR